MMEKLFIKLLTLFSIINVIYCEQIGIKTQKYSPVLAGTAAVTPGTITYTSDNATVDAAALYNAVTGIGTNETAIINILANRKNSERQYIKTEYHEMFQTELVDDLKGDASGNFRRVVKALLMKPQEYIASQLHKALISLLSEEKTIIKILCTKNRDELKPLLNAYEKLFSKALLADISEGIDGDLRTFIGAIISDPLREEGIIDTLEAKNQINIIPNVNDFCTVSKNPALKEFFSKQSFEQINYVCNLHQKDKMKSVQEQLKRWCTADETLQFAYETVVRYATDAPRYFAEELYNSMAGFGTDDKTLIRIIISRSEIDLSDIKKKYKVLYNTTLESDVASETSGYYKSILLKLLERADVTGVYLSY